MNQAISPKVSFTASNVGNLPANWTGHTGYISKELIADVVPDYRERLFYISGPPKMVITLDQQLSGLNLAAKQIRRDSFTGYD